MNNTVVRALSGACYVATVVASILYQPYFFGWFIGIVAVFTMREYALCLRLPATLRRELMILASAVFIYAHTLFYTPIYSANSELFNTLFVFSVVALIVAELFKKDTDAFAYWGASLFGIAWIIYPYFCMINILDENKYLLLSLYIIVWVNDTGAYCVGKLMSMRAGGNHKMAPTISPNKSWEGLAGGIIFAVAAALLLQHLGWIPHRGWLFGFIVALVGTLGDLVESQFKRRQNIKDSGTFLPGHGGFLDRFDSVLLASVVIYWIYCVLC